MADIEKVIKGLEWILKDDRFGFGKGLTKPETDEEQVGCYIHDALELLKEQDKLLRKKQKDIDKLCCDIADLKHRFHEKTEIVRCKDCKFHHASEKLNLCWCEKDFVEGLHSREWFCADGEREEI